MHERQIDPPPSQTGVPPSLPRWPPPSASSGPPVQGHPPFPQPADAARRAAAAPPLDDLSHLALLLQGAIGALAADRERTRRQAEEVRRLVAGLRAALALSAPAEARTRTTEEALDRYRAALRAAAANSAWRTRLELALNQVGASPNAGRLGRVAITAAIGAASLATPARTGAANMATAPAAAVAMERPLDVVVAPGDTLVKLSERYYGTASRVMDIARANGLSNPDHLAVGMTLTLPDAPEEPVAAARGALSVVVQPGDTLRAISARVYGDERLFTEIARVNGLSNPDRIVAGMTLTVPPRSGAANFRVVSSGGAGNAGAAVPQAAGFIWPTRGSRVPDGDFGAPRPGRPSPTHTGLDLAAPSGTPVVAARSGKVVHAGPEGTYGNTVVIDHGDGFQTRSAHLSAWNVSTGQWVAQGQVIGLVGATGLATGPHLHFEVIQHGRFINPVRVLP